MTVLFDTLKLADRLESAGFNHEQARGLTAALGEATSDQLATKSDLAIAIADLRIEIYKALAVQTVAIVGLTVTLLKLL